MQGALEIATESTKVEEKAADIGNLHLSYQWNVYLEEELLSNCSVLEKFDSVVISTVRGIRCISTFNFG